MDKDFLFVSYIDWPKVSRGLPTSISNSVLLSHCSRAPCVHAHDHGTGTNCLSYGTDCGYVPGKGLPGLGLIPGSSSWDGRPCWADSSPCVPAPWLR